MPGELDPQPTESSAERQADDVIKNLLRENPLPEAPKTPRQEGVYALASREAHQLSCVALIRDGQVIPIVILPKQQLPRTPGEKMQIFALVARTILDGLLEALEFWEYRRKEHEGTRGAREEHAVLEPLLSHQFKTVTLDIYEQMDGSTRGCGRDMLSGLER